jgi:phage terminase large subunit-like protein
MMAGNRVGKCVTGNTLIDCPDGSSRHIDEIRGQHWVWAWDGEKKVRALAGEPFKKPPERVYRVWTRNGHYVDCAGGHRFLGVAGWLFLSDLFGYVPCLPRSTEEFGQIASAQDVARYLKRFPSSAPGYPAFGRFGGGLLQSPVGGAPGLPPLRDGALRYIPALSRHGVPAGIGKHILSRHDDHLSSLCVVDPTEGLSVPFSHEILYSDEQLCQPLRLVPWPQHDGLASGPQSGDEDQAPKSVACAIVSPRRGVDFIIGYQELNVQDIWDFHVPEYHNYCTAGMVHHNTEGAGGYETVLHLTGLYPHWWIGRRFPSPVNALVAGDTGTTTRDILQNKICGPVEKPGTGLIPHASMGETSGRAGVAGAYDIVKVKHEPTGSWSTLQFRSYDQGRVAFQGTEREVVYLDEEPPKDVYDECLLRTMTTNGIVLCTFTPLLGLSDVALSFMPHLAPAI